MTHRNQFRLTFTLLDHGWAEAVVHDGDRMLDLEISYVCDPLGDLARAVADLRRSPGWERCCSWVLEPGEYRWCLKEAGDHVDIKIVWFREWSPGLSNDRGELVFEASASYRRVATQVCGQMKRVLNEFGTDGYRERWRKEFPAEALRVLVDQINAMDSRSKGIER